jgi:hypothetical protein
VRLLARNPGFTIISALTLALGIGATSAIFSVLDAVVLQPLPFRDPDRLVFVQEVDPQGRARPPLAADLAAWTRASQTIANADPLGGISEYSLASQSGDTAQTIVISHELWQTRFGGDPEIIGKPMPGWNIVIGVMPPGFWMHPSMANADGFFAFAYPRMNGARGATVARPKPGATIEQARDELDRLAQTSAVELAGGQNSGPWRIRLTPLHDVYTDGYDPVRKHLPDAPAFWDEMTIFHLLSHTAGFQGLATPPAARVPIESPDGSMDGFIAQALRHPLESVPGATFNYTNTGYFILGHLIQKVSGQSYERFIQENILTPLGLKDTGLAGPANLDSRARFYNAGPKGPAESELPDRELNMQVEFVRDPSGVITELITHQGARQDPARRIQ